MPSYHQAALSKKKKKTYVNHLFVNYSFSIQDTETWLLMLEPGYYGRQMNLGAAVTLTSAHVGGAIGVTVTGLLHPHLAVVITVVACSLQALLACSMSDGTEE